jgi:hypothetical protein
MGCHLGWHFAIGCPLRGGRGKLRPKTRPKTIKEKKKGFYIFLLRSSVDIQILILKLLL